MEEFVFVSVELREVPASPFLQSVNDLVPSLHSVCQPLPQFGIVHKIAEAYSISNSKVGD